MRKIKFRAWDRKYKRFLDNSLEIDLNGHITYTEMHEESREVLLVEEKNVILMQFTGLKDRKGKDIFEGDILRIRHPRGKYVSKGNVVVEWKNCEFYARKISKMVIEEEESLGNYRFKDYDVEVIGNIFEDITLLQRSAK